MRTNYSIIRLTVPNGRIDWRKLHRLRYSFLSSLQLLFLSFGPCRLTTSLVVRSTQLESLNTPTLPCPSSLIVSRMSWPNNSITGSRYRPSRHSDRGRGQLFGVPPQGSSAGRVRVFHIRFETGITRIVPAVKKTYPAEHGRSSAYRRGNTASFTAPISRSR